MRARRLLKTREEKSGEERESSSYAELILINCAQMPFKCVERVADVEKCNQDLNFIRSVDKGDNSSECESESAGQEERVAFSPVQNEDKQRHAFILSNIFRWLYLLIRLDESETFITAKRYLLVARSKLKFPERAQRAAERREGQK